MRSGSCSTLVLSKDFSSENLPEWHEGVKYAYRCDDLTRAQFIGK